MSVTDYDYGKSGFWTWDDRMWDQLRWLRQNDPVHWSDATGMFILTCFDEVSYVSKHNELFCSGQGVLPDNPAKLGLIDEDEPRHTVVRRLINKGFTPRMVKKLEEDFEIIVKEAIDAVAQKGECDFVDDIAVPLPLLIIADMIGVRKEDRHQFHQWSDAMILAQGNLGDPGVAERAAQAFVEYGNYAGAILEDRRSNPKDDLMSILVHAKDAGVLGEHEGADERVIRLEEQRQLNKDELIMFCVLLLVAGNETTRNGLSGSMKLLIEQSDVRQRLIDDPELIAPAVEEMLRLTSPVISFVRTATEDTELSGKKIAKGQKVLMVYPSANRDEKVFTNPDVLDIDRNPLHLAFGIGNHFCLGANLARMEMRVAFRELLRRIPDMSYASGGPTMSPSALVRSFHHMNVRFTPEATAPTERATAGG